MSDDFIATFRVNQNHKKIDRSSQGQFAIAIKTLKLNTSCSHICKLVYVVKVNANEAFSELHFDTKTITRSPLHLKRIRICEHAERGNIPSSNSDVCLQPKNG